MKEAMIEYGNGIYAIDQGMVRIFLILGAEKGLVLDAGVTKTGVTAAFRRLTDLPLELCLSHSDPDHIANISEFNSLFVHEAEKERLLSAGIPKALEIHTIREGHIFDLGGRRLEVIACPGHTPGSISLLDRENKILFPGDTVSRASVYMFSDGRDMESYIATLRKLHKLWAEGTFSLLYPAHGACPIGGEAVSELIECAELIKEGRLSGEDSGMKDKNVPVLEYRYGNCGIFHT